MWVYNISMEMLNSICPICETINPRETLICKRCGQDTRSAPLQDYISFTSNPPEIRKRELIVHFGILRHKVNISFDSVKYLIDKEIYKKALPSFLHYRLQIERERSSLSYYLFLYSRKVFFNHFGLLMLDCHVYFALMSSFAAHLRIPKIESFKKLIGEGLYIVEKQKEKLVKLIDKILDSIESASEEEIEAINWDSPPPPPTPELILGMRKR